jgi:hypothetical protein
LNKVEQHDHPLFFLEEWNGLKKNRQMVIAAPKRIISMLIQTCVPVVIQLMHQSSKWG